jgi:hypothetical protein
VLTVNVLRCKHLNKADLLGLSDPYVRLQLNDNIQKTKVIRNNLNPEWKETFSMIVNDPESDVLEISVYDWDQVLSFLCFLIVCNFAQLTFPMPKPLSFCYFSTFLSVFGERQVMTVFNLD